MTLRLPFRAQDLNRTVSSGTMEGDQNRRIHDASPVSPGKQTAPLRHHGST